MSSRTNGNRITEIAENTVETGTNLLLGQILATFVNGIGIILLIRILNVADYGIYGLTLIPISLLSIILDWGLPRAIQQRTTKYGAQNLSDLESLTPIVGLLWQVFLGALAASALILVSTPIASIMGQSMLAGLLPIVAIILPANAVINIGVAKLVANQKSKNASIILVSFAVAKAAASVYLAIIGLGASGALFGYAFSSTIIGIIASWIVLKHRPPFSVKPDYATVKRTLGDLLRFAGPVGLALMIANTILPVIQTLSSPFISPSDFAFYSAALLLFGFLSIPFTPIVQSLLSGFTEVSVLESQDSESAYRFSTKLSSILLGSTSVFALSISYQIVTTLFGIAYQPTAMLFAIMCLSYILFTPYGSATLGTLFISKELTSEFVQVSILALITSIPLTLALLPLMSITTLPIVGLLINFIFMIGFGILAERRLEIKVFTRTATRMLLCLILLMFIQYFLLQFLSFFDLIPLLVIDIVLFYLIFSAAVVYIGDLKLNELNATISLLGGKKTLLGKFVSILGWLPSRIAMRREVKETVSRDSE
ncbi:MAG: oligosaccharide flippase family protein [Candidatus Thorarchaeota archaeon]